MFRFGRIEGAVLQRAKEILCARPWYEPTDEIADQLLITETILIEFDTLLAEPDTRAFASRTSC
jgi:hypothetical protein